jgi:hypothetical protein
MADIKDIDVFQTVTSVSFEVEPNTDVININKVTIQGTGGGSQDLQSVTDIGATTTNTITANSITTTIDSTINGVRVGRGNIASSTSNTAVGYQALQSNINTTGNEGRFNTAFGSEALKTLTTGYVNDAFGQYALRLCTTGTFNLAVGNQAMANSTTATINTAIGQYTLRDNISGSKNTAVGNSALMQNTGSFNTAIGNGAGGNATSSGSSNILVGFQAGRDITTGSNNLLIENITNASISSGSFNIILNPKNKAGVTTGSYNTIIGAFDGTFPSAMANNVILADGQGNIRFRTTETGLTTVPAQTNTLINGDASGKAVATKEYVASVIGGAGATNLSPSQTATNFTINSDTGTDATIPLGNGTLAGATLNDYTTAEKNKLAGIATGAEVNVNADWNATSGDAQILNKPTIPSITNLVPYTGATTDVNLGLNDITAEKLIKSGGFDYQFLKADGSVDNNIYLTSADLPSTLDLYATTTASDISGYTVLVRNIADTRYNATAQDVSTGVIASVGQLVGSLITDANIISGNPGVFDFKTIGNISRTNGTGQAEFFFRIYKRNLAGTETLIAESDYTLPVTNGGYVEFSATALWNDGIFLDTDRVVLKYYANRLASPVGSDPTYQFQFGGASPVRSSAAIPTSVMPNIYLRDLADVENVDALNNEILYWNDVDSLWEHSLVENLVPLATATQKGLVSTTSQTFAGTKTFTGAIGIETNSADLGLQVNSGDIGINVYAEGIGIEVESILQQAGVFNLSSTNTSNIVEFKKDNVLKAAIQNDGKITATAGTASTDVVVKSQLDLKANDSNVVHLTGLETIAGTKTFSSNIVIPATGTPLILSTSSGGTVSGLLTTTYPDLTELTYLKGVTSSIQTQFSGKQATLISGNNIKSINGNSILGSGDLTISASVASQGAFTVLANNTSASAVPTEQVFKDVAQQNYTETPTWSTSAPTTILANTYEWSRIGSTVNVRISLSYDTAATNSSVILPMPADMPIPASITGFTAASDILSYGSGMMLVTKISTAVTGARNCLLRRNAANTGYEFFVNVSVAVSTRVVIVNLTYFA